jgi:O-methyltransferase
MDASNGLYGKVTPGGYVIIDDYNSFAGCRRAVTEFRNRHCISSELMPIDRSAVFWRR